MPAVKIHGEKFENLIHRRGRPVRWEEANICSCWNLDSGQPNYSCQACKGFGYTYEGSVEGIAVVMSITANKDFEEVQGVFDVGDAVMVVPKDIAVKLPSGVYNNKDFLPNPMFDIGMYDKVTLLDDAYKTSEILIKGTNIYGRPADTLLNEEVTRIKAVRKVDSVTGNITNYIENTDYQLNGNKIDWLPLGSRPSEGESYSVVYFHRPVYTVLTNLPKPRHQDGQDLPKFVALRYRAGGFDRK